MQTYSTQVIEPTFDTMLILKISPVSGYTASRIPQYFCFISTLVYL